MKESTKWFAIGYLSSIALRLILDAALLIHKAYTADAETYAVENATPSGPADQVDPLGIFPVEDSNPLGKGTVNE